MTLPLPLPPVGDVVPHKPPMLLLDRVVSFATDAVTCQVTIAAGSPFVEDGRVPAVIGIEYMAQCVAAFAGLTARAEGRPPRIGFLLGCRELVLQTDAFTVGDTLTVEARRTWGDNDLGNFACLVQRNGQTVASGTLNVYQGPLPDSVAT
jgi:predicted hotdog family 3-hydroxylacyl-ACP dehydratase